jgi:nucleoside-diphosphate-sugar epimerase
MSKLNVFPLHPVPGVLQERESVVRRGDSPMKEGRQTCVLTGATGFLGSHLMAALLERGDRLIILGRPHAKKGSLGERVAKLLAWFGLEDLSAQVETAEVDLLKPLCGLEADRYNALCARTDHVIHCASDTRFSEKNRLESIATNVLSLKGIIEFATDSDASWFHYISTAYAVGVIASFCPEAPVTAKRFANVYEETKAQAEKEVAARCGAHAIPFTIIRPSIVYGDSRSGRASRFNALYNYVKWLYCIRKIYLEDIEKHGGEKSRECGIYLDSEGILNIPLRMVLPQRRNINLIPIDYFVAATLSIMGDPEDRMIYNVTSDAPKTVEEIVWYCESFLRIRGIEIVYGNPSDGTPLNPADALFNKFIYPYRPYLSDRRIFDRSNTNRATSGAAPPALTYAVFKGCMDYAVSVNWGR